MSEGSLMNPDQRAKQQQARYKMSDKKREIIEGLLRTADSLLNNTIDVLTDAEKLDWIDEKATIDTSSCNLLRDSTMAVRALLHKFKDGDPDRPDTYVDLLKDITKACDEARQSDDASGPEVGDEIMLDRGLERKIYEVCARLEDGSLVGRRHHQPHEMMVLACLPPLDPAADPEPMYYSKLTDAEHIYLRRHSEPRSGKTMWQSVVAAAQ
jgi:hypothetical protein